MVTLRGPKGRDGSCGCDDFRRSELRTCWHVERVRIWYSRKKKLDADGMLSCWWSPRVWSDRVPDPLRELRIDLPSPAGRPDPLATFFAADGWLTPAPDGRPASVWAREALAVARAAAERRQWKFDLGNSVEACVAGAEREESLAAKLATISTGGEEWREIVAKLGFDLHPYQVRGALFLARTGRALLADEMGLGKTVQAIVAALLLRRKAGATKALVVCPASLKHQWRREIMKACGEEATVVDAPRAATAGCSTKGGARASSILNYELVLRDLDEIRAAGADLVILDEAQRIKNWETKTARAVKRLQQPLRLHPHRHAAGEPPDRAALPGRVPAPPSAGAALAAAALPRRDGGAGPRDRLRGAGGAARAAARATCCAGSARRCWTSFPSAPRTRSGPP